MDENLVPGDSYNSPQKSAGKQNGSDIPNSPGSIGSPGSRKRTRTLAASSRSLSRRTSVNSNASTIGSGDDESFHVDLPSPVICVDIFLEYCIFCLH